MATASIVGSEKTFSNAPGRQGKVDRVVLYKLDTDPAHTLFVIIPDETYTLEAAQAAIKRNEAERRLATPVSFPV